MPRILRILNRLIIGGPSRNAVYLSRYLQPEFETLLVTGGKEDHEQDAEELATENGIIPYSIPEMKREISFKDDWISYKKIKKLIREFRPDIVHTHAAKSGALGRLAARHCGVPVIIHTFHGHVFHSYFGPAKTNFFIRAERYLAKFTDRMIAISEKQKTELASQFRIAPADKFHIIPLGLHLDPFTENQQEKRDRFRKEFQLKEDEIAVGIIGRLVPVKNHAMFINVMQRIFLQGGVKMKAFIIGDGESKEMIKQMAVEKGISFCAEGENKYEKPLIFTSWRTDIDVICAGMDIICLTSLNEGTPVSLIEAQAAAKPIVATRVGGVEDVVIENKTALLTDAGNDFQFSEHLIRLAASASLRGEMGQQGRDFVLSRFGYIRLVADMRNLYYNLLENKNSNGRHSKLLEKE